MAPGSCFAWVSAAGVELAVIGPEFPARMLNRPYEEPIQKVIHRLTLTLASRKNAPKRQRPSDKDQPPPTSAVAVTLEDAAGQPVPLTTPNAEGWAAGNVLRIGDTPFPVIRDPPRVKLEFPSGPLYLGCATIAVLATQTNLEDPADCSWTWHRLPPDASLTSHPLHGDSAAEIPADQLITVGTERCYTPSNADVGRRLLVTCAPPRGGPYFQCATPAAVRPFPTPEAALTPLRERAAITSAATTYPTLRVVSYNVLADCYTTNDFARTTLFGHCLSTYLDGNYRRHLLLQELHGYHADVLCLQEMGQPAYRQHFEPLLGALGYRGELDVKQGALPEGCALFWRPERLTRVSHHRLVIKDLVRSSPALPGLEQASPTIWEILTHVSTVAQLSLFQERTAPGAHLAVLNTHLFFHPSAPHIRALQVMLILHEAKAVLAKYPDAALVFCGDFNAHATDGLHDFLRRGALPVASRVWWDGRAFKWGKGEDFYDYLKGDATKDDPNPESEHFAQALHHPFPNLQSVYCEVTGAELEYTNVVPSFSGTLDYIYFHPDRLSAITVLPVPPKDTAMAFGGLPSMIFPSDHVAIGVDLRWKPPAGDPMID